MRSLRVGLTGGIASGKSTVARLFAALGVPVIDTDEIARDVVRPGTPALAGIVAAFGPEFLAPDGTLDRRRLRDHVFADDDGCGGRTRCRGLLMRQQPLTGELCFRIVRGEDVQRLGRERPRGPRRRRRECRLEPLRGDRRAQFLGPARQRRTAHRRRVRHDPIRQPQPLEIGDRAGGAGHGLPSGDDHAVEVEEEGPDAA